MTTFSSVSSVVKKPCAFHSALFAPLRAFSVKKVCTITSAFSASLRAIDVKKSCAITSVLPVSLRAFYSPANYSTQKIILSSFFLLLPYFFLPEVSAQIKRPKYKQRDRKESLYREKTGEVFPENDFQYKFSGWYWGPGVTYALPLPSKHTKSFTDSLDNPYTVDFDPGGKMGLYLEGGRYKILQYSYLFKYLDYGLAYKWLRGAEEFSAVAGAGSGKFSDHFLLAHFNLNNVINLSDNSFLQNTIGINADYPLIKTRTPGFGAGETYPGFIAQLHYKLGIGFKVSDKLMIIPALETPLLSLYPFDFPRSALSYLNSRYRPIIFSLRFLYLRPTGVECPPVYTPDFPGGIIPYGQDDMQPVE